MAISEELARADALHSDASDHYEMLAILGEEFGELQQAVLDYDYHGGSRDAILKECVQVGAMAVKTFRFLQTKLDAPRRAECSICKKPCDAKLDYCFGCQTLICQDENMETPPDHRREDHRRVDPHRPPDDGIGGGRV